MTDIPALIRQARELSKAATPEWDARVKEFSNTAKARHIWSEYGWIGGFDDEYSEANAACAASARNNLMTLVDEVEKARATLAAIELHLQHPEPGTHTWLTYLRDLIAQIGR